MYKDSNNEDWGVIHTKDDVTDTFFNDEDVIEMESSRLLDNIEEGDDDEEEKGNGFDSDSNTVFDSGINYYN